MRIDAVDLFYVAMPTIEDIGDGSQDALLVRVRADGFEGWGECEASPLTSIASMVAPLSHSACKPVGASIIGAELSSPADIQRLGAAVRRDSYDLLQAAHTWSGIDIALWDLLGQRFEVPVYELLGFKKAHPKRPYASVLFGTSPDETYAIAKRAAESGFGAVKMGWSGFGEGGVGQDVEHLRAARAGVGAELELMVDAAMAWGENADLAALRMDALNECRVLFLEEPFTPGANNAYRRLHRVKQNVRIAAGEGSHSFEMAIAMIDEAKVDYIQIDAGRVGGITEAARVAAHAAAAGIPYINHTFTSHLALSASLQPYAGDVTSEWCEYPIDASPLATSLTSNRVSVGKDGLVRVPDGPGLGVSISHEAIRNFLVDVQIVVGGVSLFSTIAP